MKSNSPTLLLGNGLFCAGQRFSLLTAVYGDLKRYTCLGLPWLSSGLSFHASNAGDVGSIPDWGTMIPQATQGNQNKTKQNKNTLAQSNK